MPRVVNQNVDSDSRLPEGLRLHHTQINLERPQILRYRKHDYIILLKKLYRDQKASVLADEESNMFEIKKGTKQGDPLSSLLFNMVLQKALEDDPPRWQKKKGIGIYLSDNDHECLTNLRFADDVFLVCILQRTASINRSTEKVGLRIHPGQTKILSNQSSDTRKKVEVDNISRNFNKRGMYIILGPDD